MKNRMLRAALFMFAVSALIGILAYTTNAQNLSVGSSVTVSASSTANANFPASAAIDGDRKGYGWEAGGGWNDGTRSVFPDTLTASLNRPAGQPTSFGKFIITTLQDNFGSPVEPTATQTCTLYGIKDFDIEVLNMSGVWVNVSTVTGNTLCKREVSITPTRGTAFRIIVNSSWDGLYSRIIEAESLVSSQ